MQKIPPGKAAKLVSYLLWKSEFQIFVTDSTTALLYILWYGCLYWGGQYCVIECMTDEYASFTIIVQYMQYENPKNSSFYHVQIV